MHEFYIIQTVKKPGNLYKNNKIVKPKFRKSKVVLLTDQFQSKHFCLKYLNVTRVLVFQTVSSVSHYARTITRAQVVF